MISGGVRPKLGKVHKGKTAACFLATLAGTLGHLDIARALIRFDNLHRGMINF